MLNFITVGLRHPQSFAPDRTCTLRQDTSNFAIWLIEKRVYGAVLNVTLSFCCQFVSLSQHLFRHITKLHGNNIADGSANNDCGVSVPTFQELQNAAVAFAQGHLINMPPRYLLMNENLMNYMNDPRGVKEYLLY